MEDSVLETTYPIDFHKKEATILGQHLKTRHNVVLMGMKRVGISNFLRFFLYHPQIVETYIADDNKHIFIPVDLNDLVEREVGPFWVLTLKRIADTVAASATASKEVKERMDAILLESIQTQDLFLTIDNVRKSCMLLVNNGYLPTIFYVLFDRIKDAATPEFFANLQGLRDATHQKLSYVFTSYRSLDVLAPEVFPKSSLVVFSHNMFLPPVTREDALVIYQTQKKRYGLSLTPQVEEALFDLVDGYVRYLNLALIYVNEKREQKITNKEELFQALIKDERMQLQSEELWESLTQPEQRILMKVKNSQKVTEEEKQEGRYLWETGFIQSKKGEESIFSPLFLHYLQQKDKKSASENHVVDFTKKEHMLFDYLKSHLNEISEREAIIEAVWSEVEELGVSDWAIDRLVARVRQKLKLQKSPYEIQTVKTRGYKLIEATS